MSSTRFLKKLKGFLNDREIRKAQGGADSLMAHHWRRLARYWMNPQFVEQRHQIYHGDLMMTCHRIRHEGDVIIPAKGSHCL